MYEITVCEKKIRFCLYSRAIDSEPRGRRYVKNTGHNRNCLYSRAIHSPTSMVMHYVQWFLLKSIYEITDCAKN